MLSQTRRGLRLLYYSLESKIAASYSTMLLEAFSALERRFIDSMGCASMTVEMTLF